MISSLGRLAVYGLLSLVVGIFTSSAQINIYWTVTDGSGAYLVRADANGSNQVNIVSGITNIRGPNGLETANGLLYWPDQQLGAIKQVNQAVTDAGVYDGAPWTQLLVLHSTDGLSWSRESLDELAGAKVTSSGGIRVTSSQVIVAANLADDRNPDGTPKQVLLVGTLSG